MRKLFTAMRNAPKRASAVFAMIAAAVIVPTALLAWGPDRPTYTIQQPADHITFNSITNNPNYGDERNFVTIKDTANTAAGGWTDDIQVQQGKEYWVRAYVHNNAHQDLNLVAQNVTAKFNLPTQTANRIQVDGYISASNATPAEVWDQAVFSSDKRFKLNYVPGSATFTNNVFPGGTALPDSVVSTGALLGYNQLDGKIPGCFQFDGLVIFKVKPQIEDFNVNKTVRINGAADKTFKESVNVKPGDKVDYQIHFKNTGDVQQSNVSIRDTLPTGVKYVAGSTMLSNDSGTRAVADGITTNGLNIGGYLPNGDAYLKFTAQVGTKEELTCGTKTLVNTVKATTPSGSDEDTANVVVDAGQCAPGKITVCELATKKLITIDETAFDATKHSKNVADCNVVPTTPSELPTTGPAETALSILGLGSLVASAGYYLNSRRTLGRQ